MTLKYYYANRDAVNARRREARKNRTPEQVEASRERKRKAAANAPESVKQRKREYDKKYFASPRGREVLLHSIRKRKAQRLSSEDGTVTYQALQDLMVKQNHKCYHCGKSLKKLKKKDIHLDHYIPLAKGGAHTIKNVVWSCAPCNHKKSDSIMNSRSSD